MTVIMVDDHPILSMGLIGGIQLRGYDAIAIAPSGPAHLVERITTEVAEPDLVVMDLAMPTVPSTPDLVAAVTKAEIRVMILSGSEDADELARCLLAGAISIVSKSEPIEAILDTIEDAVERRTLRVADCAARLQQFDERLRRQQADQARFIGLTSTEAEVLERLMDGRNAQEIASERFVSLATVRTQIKSVLSKLGVGSQLEAVAVAHRCGYKNHLKPSLIE